MMLIGFRDDSIGDIDLVHMLVGYVGRSRSGVL